MYMESSTRYLFGETGTTKALSLLQHLDQKLDSPDPHMTHICIYTLAQSGMATLDLSGLQQGPHKLFLSTHVMAGRYGHVINSEFQKLCTLIAGKFGFHHWNTADQTCITRQSCSLHRGAQP